ncbi:substrate-binding domain-containing protein [Pinirhizobacter sp.]|uniref:substrate-binding domain-containing protein n=1 Tax=Pinirhizobacter sp. TaxID=2950432 RepID=UPI002F3FB785
MKLLAGALLIGFASLASAQSSIVVGGGATLPASGYAGDTTTRLQGPLHSPATGQGTLLGEYAATQASTLSVSYCQTGSGGGKNILAGNQLTAFAVNADCVASPNPIGFGATSLGETLAQPHFVGSDSPLAATDLSNYAAGHTSGQPVQIPSVSGAIAIVFSKIAHNTATNVDEPLPALNLTEAQVCRVFSGNVKTWNDANLASAIPSGYTVSGPIKIVYRSDGSGTSFAFSNHLSKVCGSAVGTGGNGLATAFVTDQAFTTAASAYLTTYSSSDGASGNPGVITEMLKPANDGAIGYAETANALNAGVLFASVSTRAAPTVFIDPSTYGGTVLPVSVTYDKVISSVNGFGRPVLGNSGFTTQCIGIVNPEDYAEPTTGDYPIVAVSYLLANSAANGLDVDHVRGVLYSPYDPAVTPNVATIGEFTGLSFLSINGVTDPTQIQTKINGCVN